MRVELERKRRSLVLAGGGMKVAFQAGALQVWLDEAGLEFDHFDGASGGVFNLAMLCQGLSGSEIAENWRRLPALAAIQPNWRALTKPLTAESLTRLDRLRARLFRHWNLDFEAIRRSGLDATFNSYNFTRHELRVIPPDELTEDLLISCVSLPRWFPPVRVDSETYIDSVYISDANVEEAIRHGADEIWVIWTVSERSEWGGGFLGNYFGVIETAANGHFRSIVRRIEASNAALARGGAGEFGRPIELKILRDEVPLHYLINLNPDRFTQAVERGVRAAREWCDAQGIRHRPSGDRGGRPTGPALRFTEELLGSLTIDGDEQDLGLRLDVRVDDVEAFIAGPERAAAVTGEFACAALGGRRPMQDGEAQILVDDGDFTRKQVRYQLHLTAADGRPLTLIGVRRLDHASGSAWQALTTVDLHLFEGHVEDPGDALGETVGTARLGPRAAARLLRSIDVAAPGSARRRATARFALLWLGSLWDVYGRRLLPVSPI